MKLIFRPIDRWDWPETTEREGWARFRASYSDTLTLLDRELRMLGAASAVLQVDATEDEVRNDGQLRASARVGSPRVILAFDSVHGPLKYHCDRFTRWQTNLRAIALGLEALRKVERYGIASRAEQYRGWQELPSGIAMPAHTMTRHEAAEYIVRTAGAPWHGGYPEDAVENLCDNPDDVLADAFKVAAKVAHPDQGGDTEAFKRLVEARDLLAS